MMLARLCQDWEGEEGSHSPQGTIAAAEGDGVKNYYPEPGKHFRPGRKRPEGQQGCSRESSGLSHQDGQREGTGQDRSQVNTGVVSTTTGVV